jgi:hypothetical protein
VVVALSAPVLALPLTGSLPDQPPEAVQLVAPVDDQLSVADRPLLTSLGLLVKEIAGVPAAEGDTACAMAVPPVADWLPPDVVQSVSAATSVQYSMRRRMPAGRRMRIAAIRIEFTSFLPSLA